MCPTSIKPKAPFKLPIELASVNTVAYIVRRCPNTALMLTVTAQQHAA